MGGYDPDNTEKGVYPIEFSNQWKQVFMEHHTFSGRKLGTKTNKKGATPGMMNYIQEYHLEFRVLQLSPTPILTCVLSPDNPNYFPPMIRCR